MAGVENHDGVGIDGGNFFYELVLIAGQAENGTQAGPDKHDSGFCRLGGGDGGFVVCFALFRGVPVEPNLNGSGGGVRTGADFDCVRASSKVDSATHIIEAVGGGNYVVLVGLQDVSMDAALECASGAQALAVKRDAGVGAEGLQIEPVGAGVRRSE